MHCDQSRHRDVCLGLNTNFLALALKVFALVLSHNFQDLDLCHAGLGLLTSLKTSMCQKDKQNAFHGITFSTTLLG